jgi:hypothetical protein
MTSMMTKLLKWTRLGAGSAADLETAAAAAAAEEDLSRWEASLSDRADRLVGEIDGVLRLLSQMRETYGHNPRVLAAIAERTDSTLDERNRLMRLRAGIGEL